MKPESIVLTVAGMCFGVILGWVLATLNVGGFAPEPAPVAAARETPPPGNEREPARLDEAQVQALETILASDPDNAGAAAKLGETYLEAEQVDKAIEWLEKALRLDPKNVDASTQLGMSYFIAKGPDPALAQLEKSLKMVPNHPRTLLSKGIVLWQGKQDLDGAAAAWQQVVDTAPTSPEAEAAKQGLTAIASSRGRESAAPASP